MGLRARGLTGPWAHGPGPMPRPCLMGFMGPHWPPWAPWPHGMGSIDPKGPSVRLSGCKTPSPLVRFYQMFYQMCTPLLRNAPPSFVRFYQMFTRCAPLCCGFLPDVLNYSK